MSTITVGGALKVWARNRYVTDGVGVAEIMEETGKSYEEIRLALSESGVLLMTGGPHDTAMCRHDHRLALEHASGRCQHPVTSRKRNARERRELHAS
jgi:hypothetical protein